MVFFGPIQSSLLFEDLSHAEINNSIPNIGDDNILKWFRITVGLL